MLTSVALAGNITSMAFNVLVIGVLSYCRSLLNKAKAVPVSKYGNDKILTVLLWLSVFMLCNIIIFVIFNHTGINNLTNYIIMSLLKLGV